MRFDVHYKLYCSSKDYSKGVLILFLKRAKFKFLTTKMGRKTVFVVFVIAGTLIGKFSMFKDGIDIKSRFVVSDLGYKVVNDIGYFTT